MNSTVDNPHQSWGKRLLAFLLWGLLAAIFGLCGWYFMLRPVATAVGNWSLARDYQSVQGEVVPHTGEDGNGSFTWYGVRYASGVRTYETSRLSVLEDEAIDEPYNETVFKRLEQEARETEPPGGGAGQAPAAAAPPAGPAAEQVEKPAPEVK